MAEITKAEIKARAIARSLERAGWTVTVKVKHTEAEHYPHDPSQVMLPARVFVSVTANGPESWDDTYAFSFVSWLPAQGHRASTRYAGGHQYPACGSKDRKLTLKALHTAISGELHMARIRAEQEA